MTDPAINWREIAFSPITELLVKLSDYDAYSPQSHPIIPSGPSMLTISTTERLSGCTYRDDAKRRINYIPFSGIYSDDEMPDADLWSKFPEDDYRKIVHLFALRSRIWRGESLSEADQQFWDVARSMLPDWALFRRTTISQTDRETDDMVYTCVTNMMGEFLAGEDNVRVVERDGVQTYSVTWDVPNRAIRRLVAVKEIMVETDVSQATTPQKISSTYLHRFGCRKIAITPTMPSLW
jgi:hypothetical protein